MKHLKWWCGLAAFCWLGMYIIIGGINLGIEVVGMWAGEKTNWGTSDVIVALLLSLLCIGVPIAVACWSVKGEGAEGDGAKRDSC